MDSVDVVLPAVRTSLESPIDVGDFSCGISKEILVRHCCRSRIQKVDMRSGLKLCVETEDRRAL